MKTQAWWVWCVVGLMGCVTLEEQRQADSMRELGLSYLYEGDAAMAIKTLRQAAEINPRDARVQHELGLAYFSRGLGVEAERCFERSLELDPALTEARINLAGLYMSVERYDDAIKELKVALNDPTYRSPDRAWNNLGWCYYQQGKHREAQQALSRAVALNPSFCHAWYNHGLVAQAQSDLAGTYTAWSQAVRYCPEEPEYSLEFGILLTRLNRGSEARPYFERVAAADPQGLGLRAREYLQVLQ